MSGGKETSLKLCVVVTAWIVAWLTILPAHACGPDTNCDIGNRYYRIRMPAGHDGKTPIGAILYAHGYTGSARMAMESKGFTEMARQLNVALISTKSSGKGWTLPGSPTRGKVKGADELAYFDNVIDDAAKRFPIDRKRLVVTGFSAGGMMVWNLACHRSNRFAGFIPIAGTFWQPVPKTCDTPVASIVHIHGNADKTVPIKGRPVADTHQGDVNAVLDMYIKYGRFGPPKPAGHGGLKCQTHRNTARHILNFCLYSGGHTLNLRHIRQGWDMLVAAGRL
jgi:polyhydroxybutyrate depolymerase